MSIQYLNNKNLLRLQMIIRKYSYRYSLIITLEEK